MLKKSASTEKVEVQAQDQAKMKNVRSWLTLTSRSDYLASV